jgi:hypothetical protein
MLVVLGLLLSAALPANAQDMFPYGKVRAWTGTITVEVVEKTSEYVLTYKASGKAALVDEMYPDGGHYQWPAPGAANLSDPKAAEDAYRCWLADASLKRHVRYKDEVSSADYECDWKASRKAKVLLVAGMGMKEYKLALDLPFPAKLTCTGMRDGADYSQEEDFRLKPPSVEVTGPIKPGASISGTKEMTEGEAKIKVTYSLAPGNQR